MKTSHWYIFLMTLLNIGIIYLVFNKSVEPNQAMATAALMNLILGTAFFWQIRLGFACGAVALLLGAGIIDYHKLPEYFNCEIFIFLAAMMTIMGFLEHRGFFKILTVKLTNMIKSPSLILLYLMIFAAFSAAIVDEVTSIIFINAIAFKIIRRYRLNPASIIMMLVFTTNIGSMALPLGNPVSLIIAFKAKLDIYDFFVHALPIFAINLAVVVPVCRYWLFRNDFNELKKWPKTMIETGDDKLFSKKFLSSWILLGGTLLGLAVSPLLEKILDLDKNILLMAIPLAGMTAVVFMEGKNAKNIVQNNVDWWTLFFFAALFIVVGAMSQVNLMETLSKKMLVVPLRYLPFIITGSSAILSGFLDNIIAVSVFVPMIKNMQTALGIAVNHLWWSLLFGSTLGGNLTIIGSTANIVAISQAEKAGIIEDGIHFGVWLKKGVIIVIITLIVSSTANYFI
ncbi:MAG: hypothetical protein US76_04120 [Parcubacteria group bacterium GW2011_GWA2_38_13b]|nr:MAG: hypothetical protein US76_04120 [Parcubacteria group bacterium GW2011_GWA2_38_13b]